MSNLESSLSNKFVFAMDALFGLPRKKSAGTSYRAPLHCELFFVDQCAVDQFVSENSCGKSTLVINVSNGNKVAIDYNSFSLTGM